MNEKLTMKEIKHTAILDSATELLALKPTATLQEIADYSRIGIATLHRHFASREALLDELALSAIKLVENIFTSIKIDPENAKTSLTNIFEVLIPIGNKIYFLGATTFDNDNSEVIKGEARLQRPILEAIEEWQNRGLLRNDLPSKWMLTVIYNLLFTTWQDIQSGNLAKNDAVKLLLNTVLYGFSK